MIQSMTAFARESESTRQGTLTLELRTVNHRYLDASFKLPEALRPLEPAFREAASAKLARGKFECMGRIQFQNGESTALEVDEEKLDAVLEAARSVQGKLADGAPINPLQVLQFPGVARGPELSEEDLQAVAMKLFKKALAALAENRKREGEKLAGMITERLDQVDAEVARVREIIPELKQQQRERREARITELPDGSLVFSARLGNSKRGRGIAFSKDSGDSWSEQRDLAALKTTRSNGSLISLYDKNNKPTKTLLQSIPRGPRQQNGSIYISKDGGRTWPEFKIVVSEGYFKYSALIQLDAETLGLIYETSHFRDIVYKELKISEIIR